MRLDGKRVLVTGGAQGIGRAIAGRMAEAGATLIIADIAADRGAEAAASLAGQHHAVPVDVRDEAQVTDMVRRAVTLAGGLDVVVHCAGISLSTRPFLDIPLADWQRVIDLNLTGTFLVCREAARPMVAQRSGSIITMTSVAGLLAQKGGTPYGASKAGVAHLTRIMAMDLAEHGVRANAIAPGPVEGPLIQVHGAERMARYAARIPLGRIAAAHEITGAALYLASDDSRFTTGSVLTVDGGFSVSGMR
jgi:NAD(P)-dependent dehydrogenase (short-subunit alcohol dehydrogenase family)